MKQNRKAGILLPIFSLPSKYGIGGFGESAYEFVDFLKSAGQSYWQILPLSPTGFGDSPYQSFSAFAGNPYFIDLENLEKQGLLSASDLLSQRSNYKKINYPRLYRKRFEILKKSFEKFDCEQNEYISFLSQNKHWVYEYALFMAIKDRFSGAPWTQWEKGLIERNKGVIDSYKERLNREIDFYLYLQFIFNKQWRALKKYANENGVQIIGDMPLYVSMDSSDAYFHPELFQFNEQGKATFVAGCPPDEYAKRGQLWGNPLYDWEYHKQTNFAWWIKRMEQAITLFDVVRIDHFRGFEAYYSIPSDKDATNGWWKKGPGISLFKAIESALGDIPVIAEDLGFLTPSFYSFLNKTGFPGMKVLHFAFSGDPKNPYLPHNYNSNCVVYTGTHDNNTTLSFYEDSLLKTKRQIHQYLNTDKNKVVWDMIKSAYSSVANTAIIPMQDVLSLDESARINTPSTTSGNWQWQMGRNACTKKLSKKLFNLCKLYDRLDDNDEYK